MDDPDRMLKLAERYVLAGETRITRLVALVSWLSSNGRDTAEVETSIAQLQVMLESTYEHLKVQQERYRSRYLGLSDM
jgi:hypothetical protein